jgi:hypothetical protein
MSEERPQVGAVTGDLIRVAGTPGERHLIASLAPFLVQPLSISEIMCDSPKQLSIASMLEFLACKCLTLNVLLHF